ncbi:MAG: FtsX-like permease family protein [bacterium]|nr:FtsX-like permease family protein [bacterium]
MIKHILKLVWKRKKENFLLILEIFLSFIVLFCVSTFAIHMFLNRLKPRGYEIENVWRIGTASIESLAFDGTWTEEDTNEMIQLENLVKSYDNFTDIALLDPIPYEQVLNSSRFVYGDLEVSAGIALTYGDLDKVMDLNIINGRWFNEGDREAAITPIVINRLVYERLFEPEDPIGKIVLRGSDEDPVEKRIVGVVDHYNKDGDYASEDPYIFEYRHIRDEEPPTNFMVKVTPGTTAELEAEIVEKMQEVARGGTFKVDWLEDMKRSSFKLRFAFIGALGIMVLSLFIMVATGLMGILWLNVSKRTREIGLRRAKGANKGHIFKQITGELLVVTTIGALIGFVIAIEFPILQLIPFIRANTYYVAITFSVIIIYIVTYSCGIYPSYIATKIQPAEALHAE